MQGEHLRARDAIRGKLMRVLVSQEEVERGEHCEGAARPRRKVSGASFWTAIRWTCLYVGSVGVGSPLVEKESLMTLWMLASTSCRRAPG